MSLYIVQRKVSVALRDDDRPVGQEPNVWLDVGVFDASDARAAVKVAMRDKGLEEGSFRAIPESSGRVHAAMVKKQTVWGA